MSISGISAVPGNLYQTSSPSSGFSQEFGQLASAINSGDLAGAQQAYSTLTSQQSAGQSSSSSPFSQALSQIGQSLENGNLQGAQQALSTLHQSRGGHHHGHHAGGTGESATAADSASTTPASSSTSNIVNITA